MLILTEESTKYEVLRTHAYKLPCTILVAVEANQNVRMVLEGYSAYGVTTVYSYILGMYPASADA